jgi:hypothetical protein
MKTNVYDSQLSNSTAPFRGLPHTTGSAGGPDSPPLSFPPSRCTAWPVDNEAGSDTASEVTSPRLLENRSHTIKVHPAAFPKSQTFSRTRRKTTHFRHPVARAGNSYVIADSRLELRRMAKGPSSRGVNRTVFGKSTASDDAAE